ncbi:MAG TPA: transcriptional regulator [Bacteroidetes bacterium]|nr:transcriptional regulator [Bacteroidota bacterium]
MTATDQPVTKAEIIPLDKDKLEKAAFILKTIAHPLRLGIVQLLGENEQLSVSEICQYLDCEQSLVSHHLNIMKLKGVLASARSGKQIFYHLHLREVLTIITCVQGCA